MRVLGVDPGSQRTGWGVVSGSSNRPVLIESGEIRLATGMGFAERLHRLRIEFETIVRRFEPQAAAVESPFHGVNARSALQLAHARGVLLAVLGGLEVSVVEYTPAVVKRTVTGNGRAEKTQVGAMVVRLLSLDSAIGSSDRADALAIALCHLAHSGTAAAVAAATGSSRRGPRR
jgi:crossover junction endodeoxyribonuclease RuvC